MGGAPHCVWGGGARVRCRLASAPTFHPTRSPSPPPTHTQLVSPGPDYYTTIREGATTFLPGPTNSPTLPSINVETHKPDTADLKGILTDTPTPESSEEEQSTISFVILGLIMTAVVLLGL